MTTISKFILSCVLILGNLSIGAQENNIFLNRHFWKSNPIMSTINQKINEGHRVDQLNPNGFDPVTYAILENAEHKIITYLLSQKGNPIHKRTHDGRTYLFWAAYKNNIDLVVYLLQNGARTDILDDKGYTVLNFAANSGVTSRTMYELLLHHDPSLLHKNTSRGANALLLVSPYVHNFKLIDYLISKGLTLFDTDTNGHGVFNYATQKGHVSILKKLISRGVCYNDQTMLFATKPSRNGYNPLAFFKQLEALGVSPNSTDHKGMTPLHNLAYANNDLSSINYFIRKGISINSVDKNGNTPLINAASRNDLAVIKLLIGNNTDINHANNKGHTALTKALQNTSDVVHFLLKKGAHTSIVDTRGYTLGYHLFQTYSDKNQENFLKKRALLETFGLSVTAPQKDGNTLYHLAVEKQSRSMLDLLKSYTLNINAKNNDGYTPLQKAVMISKNIQLITYLIELGADIRVTTDFNETVYDLAMENEALHMSDLNFLKLTK